MDRDTNVRQMTDKKKDLLDKLMERENTDEMGLLDLIFIEEILNQKSQGHDSAA